MMTEVVADAVAEGVIPNAGNAAKSPYVPPAVEELTAAQLAENFPDLLDNTAIGFSDRWGGCVAFTGHVG